LLGEQKGSWVAWSIHDPRQGPRVSRCIPRSTISVSEPGLAARVALTKEEVDVVFYKRFSKEAFWPERLHNLFWERRSFARRTGRVSQVTRLFAERPGRRKLRRAQWSWLHDYNLWEWCPGVSCGHWS